MMMRTGKPTIIVIAALVMFSFGLGVGPARGLDLTDILGNILGGGGNGGGGGGGGGGQGGIADVVKVFGIAFVVKHSGDQINSSAIVVMKKHKVLPLGKMKVVPVVVAGKGANVIGAVQVMGPAEQLVHVQAVAGMPATLNGVQGIAGVPISGKAADATPTNVVPDVTISMNVRFPK